VRLTTLPSGRISFHSFESLHFRCHAAVKPKPSGIPPFPGFPHAALLPHQLADLQAANAHAGFNLSRNGLVSLQQALVQGDIPLSDAHRLSARLKEHFELPARFPGYDVEAQIVHDARVLAHSGSKTARSMSVFSDIAPRHLPPAGGLMQRIGSLIVTNARGTAAKLALLENVCQNLLGMSFPATALDPSNRSLLSISDREITGRACISCNVRSMGAIRFLFEDLGGLLFFGSQDLDAIKLSQILISRSCLKP